MAQKSKANLTSSLNIAITDALNNQNTSVNVRNILQDIIDSTASYDEAYTGTSFSGTTNYYSKFTSGNTISNGIMYDNGAAGVFVAPPTDNASLAIVSPSGFYYPSLGFYNNGGAALGGISAYANSLYISGAGAAVTPLLVSGVVQLPYLSASTLTYLDSNKVLKNVELGSGLVLSSGGTLSVTGGTSSSNTTVLSTSTGITISAGYTNINYSITALTSTCTISISGTAENFDKLIVRIKDNGTAQALTFDPTYFEAKGMALPTTTVASKLLTAGFIYDNITNKYGCVTVAQEL